MSQRRPSKEESRKRYRQGRGLWNEFDPISVFRLDPNWPQDEYESYVGPLLRLCEQGKSVADLRAYVEHTVYETIGLSRTVLSDSAIEEFAQKFHDWYTSTWPETHV